MLHAQHREEVKCSKETGLIAHLQVEREIEEHDIHALDLIYRIGTFDRRWGQFDEVFLIAANEQEARYKANQLNKMPVA
ncbi:MAG: hypothetical protein H6510_12490 [Acidobacteria bacterium]|nr:hypothetical protein [Acidobacteriota bacterium]MCB9398624.1 hypothetical protein [Acidobacteriota bacterium]